MSVHSYYEHKRTESVKLPYSFRCEHCMGDSGPLCATVTGSGTKNSVFKNISDRDEEKLHREAHKDLVRTLKRLHRDIVQKQVFSDLFTDECPHCHKPQSWGISIAKAGMIAGPLAFLIVGAFIGAGSLMGDNFGEIAYDRIPLAVGIVAAGAIATVIGLMWNLLKVNKKKRAVASGVQKNLPVIDWGAVQFLLDESV